MNITLVNPLLFPFQNYGDFCVYLHLSGSKGAKINKTVIHFNGEVNVTSIDSLTLIV
jgi:hypothetical protein